MSSEMREVDAFEAWARAQCFGEEELRRIEGRPANKFGLTWEYNGDSVQAAWAAWLERTLLARTEAGADGAVAWLVRCRRTGRVVWSDPSRSTAEGYARQIAHRMPDNTLDTEVIPLYTHPQDASGNAREAERYRWLRDEASRAQLEMFADRRGTRLAADRLCDAGIDIAMQAKEAK